jgi:hypothetical protein
MKVGYTIYNKKMEVVRSIKKSADLGGKDPDHLVELCHEVLFLLVPFLALKIVFIKVYYSNWSTCGIYEISVFVSNGNLIRTLCINR